MMRYGIILCEVAWQSFSTISWMHTITPAHTNTKHTNTQTHAQTRTKNSALDEVVYTQVKCNVINTMRDEQAQGMTRHLLQCCNQLRQLNLRSNIRCSSTLVSVTNLSHLVTCSVRCNTG